MVLVVVAKKVARKKGPKVVLFLAARPVPVGSRVLSFMGQVGPEVKKLKGGKNGREHPEENDIFLREKELKHIIGNCHQ